MAVAFGWIAVGIAIAIGSWRMDRLEQMHIEPWSAPGVVPGALGALIAVFGTVLAWRERRGGHAAEPGPTAAAPDDDRAEPAGGASANVDSAAGAAETAGATVRRTLPILALCAIFVFGLLGRGLPFVAVAAALVFAWIALSRWSVWRADGRVSQGLAAAAVIAVVSCFVIAVLFQDVFLVRLP
jgi:hypothetical protein